MPTTEERERAKKGIKARQDAIATLIKNHQPEFDELVKANRLALGLTPRAQGPTAEQLEARQKRLQEQLAKVQAELADSRR